MKKMNQPLTLALMLSLGTAQAAILFDGITSYTQNFDSLPNTPASTAQASTFTWTNDSTIDGWYAGGTTFISGIAVTDGVQAPLSSNSSSTGSYGASATAERALGIAKRNMSSFVALALTNNTGSTLTELSIQYTGEQWRRNATGPDGALNFAYQVEAASITAGTWTNFDALDFQIPQISTSGAAGALDGNAAANRTVVSANLTGLTVLDGETIWLRWGNDGAINNGHYVGIDDLTVAIPEPGTLALVGVSLGALLLFRRRE